MSDLNHQAGKAAGQHAFAEVPGLGGAAPRVGPPQHQRLKPARNQNQAVRKIQVHQDITAGEPDPEPVPVIADGSQPGDVQNQGGVQRLGLGRLALGGGGAFVAQHAGPGHPPELGALPRLLQNQHNDSGLTGENHLSLSNNQPAAAS